MVIKKLEEKNKQSKKDIHELKIYYLTRMKDYKKELDFWKDTIRKFIYQNSNAKKKNNEDLFELVTNTLRTYGTKSKEDNIDELFYLANSMNERKMDTEVE